MICPNCKKPINKTIPKEVKKKALSLHKQGHSLRDIESLLGFQLSFSSVSRIVKSEKLRRGE